MERALALHERGLVLYALRLVGDLERARDVVQETFLRLVRQHAEAEQGGEEALARWLFSVCRNLAIDVLRKERRMTHLTDDHAQAEPSPAPPTGSALETEDAAARALALLERLPDKQAEVVRLKFQQGLSYKEISRLTDVSVGQVGWLLHMAMKTLRTQLAGQGAQA